MSIQPKSERIDWQKPVEPDGTPVTDSRLQDCHLRTGTIRTPDGAGKPEREKDPLQDLNPEVPRNPLTQGHGSTTREGKIFPDITNEEE